ncbi:hypothetical protein [Paenibacillus thiaminolyticus]|uniref:hypothetical protein n=1 Tax=Paenibacillus thiaminolyticus TaxID=49283 RepID=UPI002543598B|nr:hypothetical protein [Paenibacillus thiaminolyticus]WII40151.1 hypothetical protein O0V01_14150 [Paenibacillus thiaminolyticus]
MKNRVRALIVFALLCSCLPATIRAEYGTERKAAAAFVRGNDLWLWGLYHLATGRMRQAGQGGTHSGRHLRNLLAFQSKEPRRTLYVIDTVVKRQSRRIADHVAYYSWQPYGIGLL